MKVAVTGATGFVGRAVIEALREAQLLPIPIVRKTAGLAHERIIGEINPTTVWTDVLTEVDVIIHLAARVHVMKDQALDPLAAFRAVNSLATINLARQAQICGVKRMIYVSSAKVLGEESPPNGQFEPDDPMAPEDAYAISKAEAETGLQAFNQAGALEVVIVRPPLVYGPGVGANFQTMMRWVALGLPLPLGGIKNKRSMIGIENLASLLMRCVDHPAAAGQTFLASDGEDVSTPSLLRGIAKAMNRPARLIYIPSQVLKFSASMCGLSGFADRLCGNLALNNKETCKKLEWTPPVPLERGLLSTAAAYFRSQSR